MSEYPDVPLWEPAVAALSVSCRYEYPIGWVVVVAYRREGWDAEEWVTTRYDGMHTPEARDVALEFLAGLLSA